MYLIQMIPRSFTKLYLLNSSFIEQNLSQESSDIVLMLEVLHSHAYGKHQKYFCV